MTEAPWQMDRPRVEANTSRSSRRWLRVALIGGGCLVFAVASVSALISAGPQGSSDAAWIDTVERGNLVWDVAAAGSLHQANTRVVSTPVAGSVVEIHREVGDALEPGTLIATLDNLTERRRLLEAEQELRVAQAMLEELQGELQSGELELEKLKQEMLFDLSDARRQAEASEELPDGVLSRIEVLRRVERAEALEIILQVESRRARAVIASSRARIDQQKARVAQLERLREFQQQIVDALVIVSPSKGVLKSLSIETGQWLAEGAELADMVEPGDLLARLRVPESAAASLQLGLPARLNARGIEMSGQVARIDPAVTAGTITVDVELASVPDVLRTDLSVQAFIELDRLEGVMHVARPVGVAEHSRTRLQRVDADGRRELVDVQFGQASGDRIHVLAGLAAGDRVIISDGSKDS